MEQLSADPKRSAISVGLVVYELLNVPPVTEKVTKIFPVINGEVTSPFIHYRRSAMTVEYTKQGRKDIAQVEVYVVGRTYEESVDIAEEVREAMDGVGGEAACGLVLSRCSLVSVEEDWEDDAYIQILTFNLEI